MKTILVLTDLSYKAENAALYALKLAEKMKANLILYNSITVAQSMLFSAGPLETEDDIANIQKESITELSTLAGRLAAHRQSGSFKPNITVLNDLGDLGTNVNQLITDKNIDLIVMGNKSNGYLSHLVWGETNTVLNTIKCPILFIPQTSSFNHLNTIVFSSDLKKAYPKAVSFVVDLARIDNAEIIITHIGEEEKFNHRQCLDLFRSVFEYPNTSFRQIPDGNVTKELEKFAAYVNADITVMIHHEHTLLGETIPDRSSKMLETHQTPLLILPD